MLLSLRASAVRALSPAHLTIAAVSGLAGVKLAIAAQLPLSGDEGLYWLYSKHLAFGFVDHPVLNPLMIRIGTTLFGDTTLGVRFMAVALGLIATWPVWRAAEILFKDKTAGLLAAVLFNLTTAAMLGFLAATSDTVVVFTSAWLLYFLAKVADTRKGGWWLGVGAAFGLGMCAKYTTAFFAVSILAWLLTAADRRSWFKNPWTWAGGGLAAALFAPVVLWNADHQWASFGYQSNRMAVQTLTLRFTAELIVSQLLLLTPPVAILAGLAFMERGRAGRMEASGALLLALCGPISLYFLWHSLHERVQGNWPEAVYPAVIVAAAWAARHLVRPDTLSGRVATWSMRLAAPWSLVIAIIALAQSFSGILPLGRNDPTARVLATGWDELAPRIEAVRRATGAPAIVTSDYTLLAWLAFYLPPDVPIVQLNERIRWVDAPAPSAGLMSGPLLYACRDECPFMADIRRAFTTVEPVTTLTRSRNGAPISAYSFYRLSGARKPVLDPVYPAMKDYGERHE